MSTKDRNLSAFHPASLPDATSMNFGVVVSSYNQEITSALLEGCLSTLKSAGAGDDHIRLISVPGSFELVAAADALLQANNKLDAIICLGCVIKGETRHDEYINHAIAQGIIQLNITYHIPVIFGVLTTENIAQAKARAGGAAGNKGIESAVAAIRMAALRNELK